MKIYYECENTLSKSQRNILIRKRFTMESSPELLLIDGSYYTFFRYYALMQWYRHKNLTNELDTIEGLEKFTDKFRELFMKKFKEIPKKLKLSKNTKIVVALDCPRIQIWRKAIFPEYKANRHSLVYMETELFKLVRNEELFKKAGADIVIKHPHLEADDCVALYLRNNNGVRANIITSDLDYLQLADDNTKLYDLKFKDLTDSAQSFKDSSKDLFCKIVIGDKSDNIPGVFKRCGLKTAEKYYENQELFKQKLSKDNSWSQYELNKQLIDFRMIPKEYVESFGMLLK